MKSTATTLLLLFVLTAFPVVPAVTATEAGPSIAAAQETSGETKEEKKARLEAEKQARIDAYLARRAKKQALKEARETEQQAQKDIERTRREARRTTAAVSADAAGQPEPPAAEPARKSAGKEKKERKDRAASGRRSSRTGGGMIGGGSRNAASVLERLKVSSLSKDPLAARYLRTVEREGSTPEQLGELAGFLAGRGALDDSAVLYHAAVKGNPKNVSLLYNLGAVQVLRKDYSAAARAFGHVLAIDPNHARAHYGMGTTLSADKRFDDAIEEYYTALTLDPSLGDPAVNPQAISNELLTLVKLRIYERQAQSLGLPLVDVSDEKGGNSNK